MGQSLIQRIQAKLELFRLEKRYTRRRHRRSAFVSHAVYVDGEYVYQTPNSTGTSADSAVVRIDALHGERAMAVSAARHNHMDADPTTIDTVAEFLAPERKRTNRITSMPGFSA